MSAGLADLQFFEPLSPGEDGETRIFFRHRSFAQLLPRGDRVAEYGILKRYILNCYMDLSCKIAITLHLIKVLSMTN